MRNSVAPVASKSSDVPDLKAALSKKQIEPDAFPRFQAGTLSADDGAPPHGDVDIAAAVHCI